MPSSRRKSSSTISPKDLFGDESGNDPLADLGGDTEGEEEGPALTLLVESGTHVGKQVTLRDDGAIGRSSKCVLCLRGAPGVSRRHARIERRGALFFVLDTESRNGVLLNGVEIADEAPLHDGDLIELSDEHIRVHLGAAEDLAPVPTSRLEPRGPTDDRETRPEERSSGKAPSGDRRPPTDPRNRPPMGLEQAGALLADGPEDPIPLEQPKPAVPPPVEAPFVDDGPGLGPGVPAPVAPVSAAPSEAGAEFPPRLPTDALEPLPPLPPQGEPPGAEAARAEPPPDRAAPDLAPPDLPPEPLLPPADPGSSGLEPLGLPEEPGPAYQPPPYEESQPVLATPADEPPSRRGSLGMFFVGSVVGLTLALAVVGAYDAFMNEGRLREELFLKVNAHLEPRGVALPTFGELEGSGREMLAELGLGAAGPAPAAVDAGTTADAGASPAPAPETEPLTAPAGGRVMSLPDVGAWKKKGDGLVALRTGTKADLDKRDNLEKAIKRYARKAKRRGRRGRAARRKLKALEQEMEEVKGRLEISVVQAPADGKVVKVLVERGAYAEAGAGLLTFLPSSEPGG